MASDVACIAILLLAISGTVVLLTGDITLFLYTYVSHLHPYCGQGLGSQFFHWAIEQARLRECGMVQLTSDKQRPDAIRFYESLGFTASHEGFKLKL